MYRFFSYFRLFFFLMFFFLPTILLPGRRSDSGLDRMQSYNALLASIVDAKFQLLEDRNGSVFFICPSMEGGSNLCFSLKEVRKVVLKIDKILAWPDPSFEQEAKKDPAPSRLGEAIRVHNDLLVEYQCYLEAADLGESRAEKKVRDGRDLVLGGIREIDHQSIALGLRKIKKYDVPSLFSA